MSLEETVQIASALLVALGSGGAIVAGLSGWLGKIWADRLMSKESAQHAAALEVLRSRLHQETSAELELLKRNLDIASVHSLRELNDKILIYREAMDLISEVLGDLDLASLTGRPRPDWEARSDTFNRVRLRAYTYMAMVAPQSVMDAQDKLMDYLMLVMGEKEPYEWNKVRTLGIALLNEIRKDVGIDKQPIEYRGCL